MNRYIHIVCLAAVFTLAACGDKSNRENEELLAQLDSEIARSDSYIALKQERIGLLKEAAARADNPDTYTAVNEIIDEYEAFAADSALHYINVALSHPASARMPYERVRLRIRRADVLAHAGLTPDALGTINAIPRDSVPESLLDDYYTTYADIYQYMCEYAYKHDTASEYERLRSLYSDSLKSATAPGSFNYLMHVLPEQARGGQERDVIKQMESYLCKYPIGSRQYSILASILSFLHRNLGHSVQAERYTTLSAISDTRGAIMENTSFRELAMMLFDRGDVERANRYVKKSVSDANFYSAILRNTQSGNVLPIIDDANTALQHKLTGRLRTFLWIIGALAAVLVLFLVLMFKQMKKVRRANEVVREANQKLSSLSEELRHNNRELNAANTQLRDSNSIKEQYARLFMENCSTAISTLHRYQKSLRAYATKGATREQIVRKLASTEIADELLRTFYASFDDAIYHIYPSFAEKFNRFLKPGEQLVLRPGEQLNTEQRLFALIRLGIEDNTRIAEFLRCSISTVYTYRSKMRKRAINPETFETDIRQIEE